MEPIRFADILFVLITLVITFAILWQVDKARRKSRKTTEDRQSEPNEAIASDKEEA